MSNAPTQDPQKPAGQPAAPVHDELTFNTTPNLLTLLRIALVPIVVGLMFLKTPQWDLIAALIFAAASITDYLDGYLARTQQTVTVYGKLMDPLADKFLVVSALIMLQDLGRIHPILVMLLVCRELAITGLRALASAEGVIMASSNSGKWKTATQMVAIPLLIAKEPLFGIPIYPVGQGLIYLSLAISLWSAFDYVLEFFRKLKARAISRRESGKRGPRLPKLRRRPRNV